MNNLYTYANQSSISSAFPFSLIFPHYESLGRIRIDIYLLILLLITVTLLLTLVFFISLRKALLIFTHLLATLSGSLACLYVFHDLTFNFADILWFYLVPVVYLDTLIHSCYTTGQSKWKYNRVILSLILSLLIFAALPTQTYLYHIIWQSLLYQSLLAILIINVILPSWSFILDSIRKKRAHEKIPLPTVNDAHPPLSLTADSQNLVQETNGNASRSIC